MNRSKLGPVLATCILALGGCAASQTTTATADSAGAQDSERAGYAAALGEAFNTYEHDVLLAAGLNYESAAEVDAVTRSLSAQRFDGELDHALARRGLDRVGLGAYAMAHPDFFEEQQRLYEGRLPTLLLTVQGIHLDSATGPQALLSADTPR